MKAHPIGSILDFNNFLSLLFYILHSIKESAVCYLKKTNFFTLVPIIREYYKKSHPI